MKRVTAFTLIEMLVVIAIISILASMLLPAMGSAMKSARSITCSSNLKHLGRAYAMYENEYGGWYPPSWKTYYYSYYLSPYLGVPGQQFPQEVKCAEWNPSYGVNPVISYTVSKVKRSGASFGSQDYYRPSLYVIKPTQMILLYDGKPKTDALSYSYSFGTLDSCAAMRHSDGLLNSLFYDGSVRQAPQLSFWWLEYSSN